MSRLRPAPGSPIWWRGSRAATTAAGGDRRQIVARTDGVPLFVEELTKTVLESGLLTDAGEHYELPPTPAARDPDDAPRS